MCTSLPWWDPWLCTAFALLGATLLLLPVEFARGWAHRHVAASEQHWTVRARRAFEWRAFFLYAYLSCALAFVYVKVVWESGSGCGDYLAAAGTLLMFLIFAAFWVRANAGIQEAYSGVHIAFGQHLRSLATFVLVLRPSWLITAASWLILMLAPAPPSLWPCVAAVGVLLYLANTGVGYMGARALGLVRPARPRVLRASERAQLDLPAELRGVDELPLLMTNAFSLPLLGRIAFTHKAADDLDEDALHAIALHELAHLNESRLRRWSRPLLALVLLPIATMPIFFSQGHAQEFLYVLAASPILYGAGLYLARRGEHAADAHASSRSRAYALAIEALHRLGGLPMVISSHASHPSAYDRMQAAHVQPDYPRPRPPRTFIPALALLALPIFAVTFSAAAEPLRDAVSRCAGGHAPFVRLALGGRAEDLIALAYVVEPKDARLSGKLADRALSMAEGSAPVLRAVARLRRLDCVGIRRMLATLTPTQRGNTVNEMFAPCVVEEAK